MRQFREFLNLPQSKVVLSIPPPVEKDGAYWYMEMARKSKDKEFMMCPWRGCDGSLLDGPSGGMSTNVSCDTCKRKWNFTPVINRMERL